MTTKPERKTSPLNIDYVSPASLTPYAANARFHPKRQLQKIKRSVETFGWTQPLIVDDQLTVLCGNGRLAVAIEMGLTTVPIIKITDMSEAQKKAYILADNRIAQEAQWEKGVLKRELQGLIDLGYTAELTGFDTIEIDNYLNFDPEPPKSEDDVQLPSERAPAVCALGDIWHIGSHRLAIGDARDPLIYEALLAGEKAQTIFTDPPYGCRIAGNVSGLGATKHSDFLMGASGKLDAEFSLGFLRPALKNLAAHASPGCIAFVCIDWRGAPFLLDAAQGVFHELKNLIVWHKTNAGMGSFYRSAHELIYAFKVSPGPHINNFGLNKHRANVWTYAGANVFGTDRKQDLVDHPTVKPKKMVADAILDCSTRESIVLDSYAGSGTTLVAAAMTGRRGYGIELDPKYADVTLRRLQEETKQVPLLNGVTPLPEVAAMRAAGSSSEEAPDVE